MKIEPSHPPGLKRRKLRAHGAEICRLRAQGYTCEEIRLALVAVEIRVSRSTVQREAIRALRGRAVGSAVVPPQPLAQGAIVRPALADVRSARQIAEDFMKDQVSNPLLQSTRSA